ncbi:MAG: hypothetical protein AAF549_01835 [Pseudomonadota bacterium]
MSTDSANTAFSGTEGQEPSLLDALQYKNLLERLVAQGQGYGKTESVAAFLLRDLHIVTETESGKDEVGKDVSVEPLYLVMDQAQYPNDYVRELVVKDIMLKYAQRIIGDRELNSPDFKGPGLWTSKQSSFDFDYNKNSNARHVYDPDPEATRICITVTEPISIPTAWGKPFTIEAGGTIAIRERDFQDLVETLHEIRSGKISPQDALLDSDTKSKFDIYGMNPGFLENNYGNVGLKTETQSSISTFRRSLKSELGSPKEQ